MLKAHAPSSLYLNLDRLLAGARGHGLQVDRRERRPLAPGDLVHIPAKIPHSFLVAKGKHITYVLVKFPAP